VEKREEGVALMSLVKRQSIIAFFVLAYALSWWPVPFGGFIPAGPLLAALIVIPITQGRAGLREEEGPRLPDLDPLRRYPFGAASATRPYLALTTGQFHNGHPIEVVSEDVLFRAMPISGVQA
jgi:hypothetical protein